MAREKRDYNSKAYKKARAESRKRDGYKCVLCGRKKRLQSHHLIRYADSVELRNCPKNLVTVCFACHRKVTGFELYYQELFMEIVRINSEG